MSAMHAKILKHPCSRRDPNPWPWRRWPSASDLTTISIGS